MDGDALRAMARNRPLLVALIAALLCAGSPGFGLAKRCGHCGSHCPTVAKRSRCHESRQGAPKCHDRGGARVSPCGHSRETASAVAWLVIPVPRTDVPLPSAVPEGLSIADYRPSRELPEPPTDPPRPCFVA